MCVGMAVGLEREAWQIFKYGQERACRAVGGEVLPDLLPSGCGGVYLELSLLVTHRGSVPLSSGLLKLVVTRAVTYVRGWKEGKFGQSPSLFQRGICSNGSLFSGLSLKEKAFMGR